MTPRDIESLDCELAVYRKGYLSVHINLARGYLTWRESNSWNNNFTRTLRPEQIDQLRQRLGQSGWLLKLPEETDPDQLHESNPILQDHHNSIAWSLCLKTPHGCCRDAGCDTFPDGWSELRQMIEDVSRQTFSLY